MRLHPIYTPLAILAGLAIWYGIALLLLNLGA